MRSIIFIGDYDYEAQNDGELSFKVGDAIRIYQSEGDWWYGEVMKTGEVGWVAPSYGHTREESPYLNISAEVRTKKRNELFQNIITVQSEFIAVLYGFMDSVIVPLTLRDTNIKRTILSEPSVAVSFSLLQEIYNACSNFDSILRRAKSDIEIANAYVQFAPSLQLFAQYASENSKLLNSVKTHARTLSTYLTPGQHLETSLIMPLEHYTKYKVDFQEFVWLSAGSGKDSDALAGALDIVIAQTDYVDAKLKEEAQSLMLLNLQNQFSGNPVIFTPSRRIVREGEIERVRQSKDGAVVTKAYYAHLFNDAFIYSSRNIVTGRFKLHNVVDLKGARLEKSSIPGVAFGFSLGAKDIAADKDEHFRCGGEEDFTAWFAMIGDQINSLRAHKIGKRSSVITRNNVSLPGVDPTKLGPRCALIYKFLLNELQFAEAMSLLNITVIQPLIDASKGAALQASKVTSSNIVTSGQEAGEGLQLREGQARTKDALFEGSSGGSSSQSRYQTQAVTEALQDADVQIFLRAAEGIALSLRDFVNALEVLCNAGSWAENIAVGTFFNSVSALALYNQFKAYAAGQQATLRTLNNQMFLPFYKEAELFLAGSPGSFVDKIELPRKRVKHFLNFLTDLQSVTPVSHGDLGALGSSVEALQFMEREIDELVRLKQNFEQLLEIQSSLVSLKVLGSEPLLQKLASMDRTIITQGDLKKVCRKKNKTFRFWLFNDYIIYGAALGGNKYSFNRALEIDKCSVALHSSTALKHAFEIFGAEKSFIVIAASQASQVEWVERIQKAREDYQLANPSSTTGKTGEQEGAAPLWVPDSGSDGCTVCKQDFTFWNRRHHCRKCGALVCSDHSKNKEILAHIHKSQKQKICDNCFLGKSVVPVPVSSVAIPASPATATPRASTSAPAPSPASKSGVAPLLDVVPSASANSVPPTAAPPKPLKMGQSWIASSDSDAPAPAALPPPKKLVSPYVEHVPQSPQQQRSTAPPPVPQMAPPPVPTSAPPPVPNAPPPAVPNKLSIPPAALPPSASAKAEPTVVKSSRSRAAPPPPPHAPLPVGLSSVNAIPLPPPAPVVTTSIAPPPVCGGAPPPPPASSVRTVPASPVALKSEEQAEDVYKKYKKMLQMLPEGAVVQKMANDGFAEAEIKEFLLSSSEATIPAAKLPSVPTASGPKAGPPPPPPPPAAAHRDNTGSGDIGEVIGEGQAEAFRKYLKMKEMLPPGAVRQKMVADGFGSSDVDSFLAGEVSYLKPPSATTVGQTVLQSLASPPALKSVDRSPPPPRKTSLMDEIQSGSKLRSVQKEDTRMKQPAIQGAGGLLGMLASEMSKRRFNMKVEHEEDDDSDSSGFSDSDSDSDGDD